MHPSLTKCPDYKHYMAKKRAEANIGESSWTYLSQRDRRLASRRAKLEAQRLAHEEKVLPLESLTVLILDTCFWLRRC